jgi:hypothetical protein
MYSSTHSLTSALDGGELSASHPNRFTPRERAPGTHWIGGCVDLRAVLDAVAYILHLAMRSFNSMILSRNLISISSALR